jgi:hypothetical protein
MVAAIGTGGIPLPNRRLVSDTPRLPLRALPSFGKSVDLRWQNPAGAPLTRVSRTAAGLVIETGGVSVHVQLRTWPMPRGRGGLHGVRLRMTCPRCGASRDVLHFARGEWGCRGADCFNLAQPSRHRQRWCPAIRRRAKLLRALVRCPHGSLRARALREQIRHQERAMLANLKRANRDLTRRKHGRRRRTDSSERAR